MFGLRWESFNQQTQGTLLIVFGIILLLQTFGILEQWLNWILVIFALALIFYGLVKVGVASRIKALLTQDEQKKPQPPSA